MASTAVFATRAENGLAVVAGGGYLSFSELRSLEYTSLQLCREYRRQVACKVRVIVGTPRTLWCRVEVTSPGDSRGGGGGVCDSNSSHDGTSELAIFPYSMGAVVGWHPSGIPVVSTGAFPAVTMRFGAGRLQTRMTELLAKIGELEEAPRQRPHLIGLSQTHNALGEGKACSGGSRNLLRRTSVPTATASLFVPCRRVPLARVTTIVWMLPAEEFTSRGFRWRDGVEEIHFEKWGRICPNALSPSEVLSFGDFSNEPSWLVCAPWPPGLKKIRVGDHWVVDLRGARESWPDSLETISLQETFNQPLTGDGVGLPRSLREIELGNDFNQPLIGVEWPPFLRKLTFLHAFNQSLEGIRFPAGLREIRFGDMFNGEISGVVWPMYLKILEFGAGFDQALVSPCTEEGAPLGRQHALPGGLMSLHLGGWFNQPLGGCELPDGLGELRLGTLFKLLSTVRWPSGQNRLNLDCTQCFVSSPSPIKLPPKLETLKVGNSFTSPLTTVALPPTLKVLDLGCRFDHPIGQADGDAPLLPDGLETIRLGRSFNRSIENIRLPVFLKRLVISEYSLFNQGLAAVIWPPGLQVLQLGSCFNQPMEGTTFPKTLRELSFGLKFACFLQDVALPDGLASLSFGKQYPVSHLQVLNLPRSLRSLRVGSSRFGCREAFARWLAQRPQLIAP